MNWRNGISKWNELTLTERGNWLSQSDYGYTFCTYAFGDLPKSIQESFLNVSRNAVLRRV